MRINNNTYLIDIAVPNKHNFQKTISEKISKYAELKEKVARLCRQEQVYGLPTVVSTTGVIPKHLHHSLKLIDVKDNTL